MKNETRGNSGSNFEPGYRPVLVREETKVALTNFRKGLPDRDLFQERRLYTAAIELFMEDAANDDSAMSRLLGRAKEIVTRDMNTPKTA